MKEQGGLRMKLRSIRIINYKSIGESDNILSVDRINTIIGKNESGKSNIIEALAGIDLTGIENQDFFKQKNKINRKRPVFEIELEPYEIEKKSYPKLENMYLKINSCFDIDYTGGYEYYINNDKKYIKAKEEIERINSENRITFISNANAEDYNKLIKAITETNEKIFINLEYMTNIISYIRSTTYSDKEELCSNLEYCVNYLTDLHKFFPTFFFVDNSILQYEYTKKQILNNENIKMFKYLVNAANIPMDLVKEYWNVSDASEREQIQYEINEALEKNIAKDFYNFYTQEKITIKMRYENDTITFLIKSTNTFLQYSERSEGLKWYFNLYIKMKAAELDRRNVIYIMDEPGTRLHVNAQKELIKLFDNLSKNDNQIIYTTHSPYMIYQDNLNYIRPILKDKEGYTHIYNKYNGIPTSDKSRMDTITPMLSAIGMDYKYNLGPSMNKLNLVVEGVSDANYIRAYFHQKGTKKEKIPNIIPSAGVSNVNRIISILIGWGCDYFILLDNDNAGRKEYNVLINKLSVPQNNIIFTDNTNQYNNKANHTIENVFSDTDNLFVDPNYEDYKNCFSRELLNKVERDELVLSEETIGNFDNLFDSIINNFKNNP